MLRLLAVHRSNLRRCTTGVLRTGPESDQPIRQLVVVRVQIRHLRSDARPVTTGLRVDHSVPAVHPLLSTSTDHFELDLDLEMTSALPTSNDQTAKLWTPDPSTIDQTGTHRFLKRVQSRYPHTSLTTYEDLWRWSTENISDFWSEVWDATEVIGQKSDPSNIAKVSPTHISFERFNQMCLSVFLLLGIVQ